jgi:hypothetical protein
LASNADKTRLQFLRTLDKRDRLGVDATVELLQQDMPVGPGLDPVRAELVKRFLVIGGGDGAGVIEEIGSWFEEVRTVSLRLELMVALDSGQTMVEGKSAWDRLLELPPNADETWRDGGRPRNIGWALDDLIEHMVEERD